MSYFLSTLQESNLYQDASAITGTKVDSSPVMNMIVNEVAAYINDDIVFESSPDKTIPDRATKLPQQLVEGAILPMLIARLVGGVQLVSSVSEGGSSATIKPMYAHDVSSYRAVLNRYKRLGVLKA